MKKIYRNALVEQEFLRLLEDPGIKAVSFDIFDTLALRNVAKPVDVFFNVGSNKTVLSLFEDAELFKNFRIEAEKKARELHKPDEEITLSDIYAQFTHLTYKEQELIMNIELKEENKSLFINPQVLRWIKLTVKAGKKALLSSDMYLSYEQVEKLVLKKMKGYSHLSGIYISSELKKRKSSGTLYAHITDELSIKPQELLHVGDNLQTDHIKAREFGVQTLFYGKNDYVGELIGLEEGYLQGSLQHLQSMRVSASLQNPYESEKERFFYDFGATVLAPVLWEFSRWLKKVYKQEGLGQINFLMREGKSFAKYLTLLDKRISTNLIYASRASTYLATYENEKQEYNFYKYRSLSLNEFYKMHALRIENERIKPYGDTLFGEANTVFIDGKNLLDHFTEDFKAQSKAIDANAHAARELFLRYMQESGFTEGSALVDFGGEGKTLAAITKILPQKPKLNILFYMHTLGEKRMCTHKTYAFLPRNKKSEHALKMLQRTPEFFEILLNGAEGSTLSYVLKNDRVVPQQAPADAAMHSVEIPLQKGVESFFTLCKEQKVKKSIDRDVLANLLARTIDVPTPLEVKYLGALSYDEGNGSGMVKELINEERTALIKELGADAAYGKFCAGYFYKRREIPWMQGTITALKPDFMRSMKGIVTNANQEQIDALLEVLDAHKEIKKINIYGAGIFFKEIRPYLEQRGIEVISLIDTRAEIKPFIWEGYEVKALSEAISGHNTHPVIVSSALFAVEITDKILRYLATSHLHVKVINYYNGLVS